MTRILTGFLVGVAILASGAFAAEEVAPAAPFVQILDEAHFLAAAEDAAKRGDKDAAVQLYQSAIIYAPNDPAAYERLGHYHAEAGQPELAAQFFNSALNVQPAYAPALQGLALLALAAGNRAGAQAQHDILVRACGANCPETAQVEKALNDSAGAGSANRP
jgi:tetratricopeptide (TPR) repeat protein